MPGEIPNDTIRFYHRLTTDRELRNQREVFPIEGVRNLISAAECGIESAAVIRCRLLLQAAPGVGFCGS